MVKNNRGAIPVVYLVVIGALALVGTGVVTIKKGLGIFSAEDPAKAKAQAAALAVADQRAQEAEAEAARLRKAAQDATAAVGRARDARQGEVAAGVAGVVYALEKEKDPSLNVQAGLTLAKSAAALADPVAETRLREVYALVDRLTAENAQVRQTAMGEISRRDAALDAAHQKELLDAKALDALQASAEAKDRQVATLRADLSGEISEHAKTSASLQTVAQKLGSFLRWTLATAALFFLACWVLPYVAKAHPGVGWLQRLAKAGGATFAWGLHSLHSAETHVAQGALADTGKALAALRVELPEARDKIVQVFDNQVRPEAWKLIGEARAAAEGLAAK